MGGRGESGRSDESVCGATRGRRLAERTGPGEEGREDRETGSAARPAGGRPRSGASVRRSSAVTGPGRGCGWGRGFCRASRGAFRGIRGGPTAGTSRSSVQRVGKQVLPAGAGAGAGRERGRAGRDPGRGRNQPRGRGRGRDRLARPPRRGELSRRGRPPWLEPRLWNQSPAHTCAERPRSRRSPEFT